MDFETRSASTGVASGSTTASVLTVSEKRRADARYRNALDSRKVTVSDVLACLPPAFHKFDTLANREPAPGIVARANKPRYSLNTVGSCQRRDSAILLVPKERSSKFRT